MSMHLCLTLRPGPIHPRLFSLPYNVPLALAQRSAPLENITTDMASIRKTSPALLQCAQLKYHYPTFTIRRLAKFTIRGFHCQNWATSVSSRASTCTTLLTSAPLSKQPSWSQANINGRLPPNLETKINPDGNAHVQTQDGTAIETCSFRQLEKPGGHSHVLPAFRASYVR